MSADVDRLRLEISRQSNKQCRKRGQPGIAFFQLIDITVLQKTISFPELGLKSVECE